MVSNERELFIVPSSHDGILDRRITTKNVTVYGLGHLGSWAAYVIASLGVLDFNLHDFDIVEERNISGSTYDFDDLGGEKTHQITNKLLSILHKSENIQTIFGGGIRSLGYTSQYQDIGFPYQTFNDFYILAVDGAESRYRIAKVLFTHWNLCGHMPQFKGMVPVLIDLRSGGAKLAILTIPIRDKEMQKRYLQDLKNLAAEPGETRCNEANIIQVPFYVAAILAQTITSFTRGVCEYYCYQGSLLDLSTFPYKVTTDSFLPRLDNI